MLMATTSSPRPRRRSAVTAPLPRRPRDASRPLMPGVLVIGGRHSETAALSRAFEQQGATVTVARTLEAAHAQLNGQRWRWVLIDARWEAELEREAREAAQWLRFYVTDAKRALAEHQPIPLAQADVQQILTA